MGVRGLALALGACALAGAQKAENVLVVVNQASAVSQSVGEYYALKRAIPLDNICRIRVDPAEDVSRADYDRAIAAPVARCLTARRIAEKILYIATTSGVPLRIAGKMAMDGDMAAVDSELALLYGDLHGRRHPLNGPLSNPFFARRTAPFRHPDFPIYLVTRLTGYNFEDVKAAIDRSLAAKNRGVFVIDLKSASDEAGNDWLRTAALALPKERVALDESDAVVYGRKDVIGYAAWGSNDPHRKRRFLGFGWLPGAVVTEYVSSNARTFARPPDGWSIGTWADRSTWFAGSPQTMTADYIHEGATGASGHVGEPYLHLTPRPDYLLPAYFSGRNLAESYYLAIPALSWMNVVVGDPLCALGKP